MALRFLRFQWATVLLVTLVAAQTATGPQQIFTLPAFSQQQLCVQSCYTKYNGCTTDLVGSVLGCPIAPCTFTSGAMGAPDNCYCRGDLQGAAQSYLSACVEASCTVGDTSANVATAVSLYAGYCTSLGFTANAASNNDDDNAQTTSLNTNLRTSGTTNRAGPTETTTTETGSTSSASSTPNTTLYIVVAVVGGMAFLLFIASATWASKYRKLKQRRQNGYPGGGGPYGSYSQSMQPMSSHTSNHPLRFDHDVYPNDSASNVGVPVVPPAYPHPMEPSLVSTRMY
jgi:hypothetical protein